MKTYKVDGDNKSKDATKKSMQEILEIAYSENNSEIHVIVFNPEKHIIVSKHTPAIIAFIGVIVGIIATYIAL